MDSAGVQGVMAKSKPTLADHLSGFRLLALPVLWLLAALDMPVALGVGVAVAGTTDMLDGPAARWSGRPSRYGSQLDSTADMLLVSSMVIWAAWLKPEFFAENAAILIACAGLGLASLAATLVKFGQLGDLHLYSAKTAGVVGYVFWVSLFVLGGYNRWFFVVAAGLWLIAATETLLVAFTRARVDERIGTILRKERRQEGRA